LTLPAPAPMLRATKRPLARVISLRHGWRHMRLSRCIEDYLTTCRVRRLSTATLITYENSLNGLRNLALVNGRDEIGIFTPALIEEYFAKANAKGNSIPTLVKKRVALRRFADWGLRRRLWLEDPTLNAPAYRLPERLPRPFDRRDRPRDLDDRGQVRRVNGARADRGEGGDGVKQHQTNVYRTRRAGKALGDLFDGDDGKC